MRSTNDYCLVLFGAAILFFSYLYNVVAFTQQSDFRIARRQRRRHQGGVLRQGIRERPGTQQHRYHPKSYIQNGGVGALSSISPSSSNSGDRTNKNNSNKQHRLENEETAPKILDWNLPALLSQEDASMDVKLIPLMDVYNSAISELKREGSDGQEKQKQQQQKSSFSSFLSSFGSLDYTGKLSPNVEPFRRFVRKYDQDIGHDGRFTVFCSDNCDSDNDVEDENDENDSYKSNVNMNIHQGGSLQADVIFSMNNPLAYIRDVLSYRVEDDQAAFAASSRSSSSDEEAVVFIPGMNTFHEQKDSKKKNRQRTSVERVKYYSQVLDGVPIAQIHAGTYLDQGDVDVQVTPDTMNALKSFNLLTAEGHNGATAATQNDDGNEKGNILLRRRLRARDLDLIRINLSRSADSIPFCLPKETHDNDDTEKLKKTIMKLIDISVKSLRTKKMRSNKSSTSTPHLVLMSYSATCSVLAAALSEWKHQATTDTTTTTAYRTSDDVAQKQIFSEEEVESLLRKSLTVVTIGALSRQFVDGPAYIHVSMHDDALASSLGVSKERPDGGGEDAVFLHGISPYVISSCKKEHRTSSNTAEGNNNNNNNSSGSSIYGDDAHNMDACAIQYLSLIRRINGVTSFRDLYDLANDDGTKLDIKASFFPINYKNVGQLVVPPHIDDELLPSMIRATGGERWLWNPDFELGEEGVDGFDSPLPSLNDAESDLTCQFGYGIYDEIVEACWK